MLRHLFLCVVLLLAGAAAEAVVRPYTLERRIGEAGAWAGVANFTLRQLAARSPVELRHARAGGRLAEAEKLALARADRVFYRAFPTSGEGRGVVVVVVVSPCTLIRGFFARDGATVVLYERLNVVAGANGTLYGLQVSSEANLFHANLDHDDECDRQVVQTLFPNVQTELVMGLAPDVEPENTIRYEDIEELRTPPKAQKGKKKTVMKRVKNEDNEWEEREVVVEEQTFFQKYWIYIAIFIGVNIMKSFAG